jgi:hypothetical protein
MLTLANELVPIFAIVGSMFFGLGWLVVWFFSDRRKTIERERTKREIAAYVAEGTISPQDAERIITAQPKED